MCTMRHTPWEGDRVCTICSDPIHSRIGSVYTQCCNQWFHRRCVELWRRDGMAKRCPVCRTE
jgi:hypothetical protein